MKKLTLEALLGLCLAAALTGCAETRAEPTPELPDTVSATPTNAMAAPPAVAPAAAAVTTLPAELKSNAALEDVVRLLRAGVEGSVLLTHIRRSKQPFNVGTDEILYLTDLGASGEIINAMMARDSELAEPTTTQTAEPVTPQEEVAFSEPPAEAVSVEYFGEYLAPYGIWVDIPGYGRCWQPTVAVTTSGWMPYADAGRWLYTDYGWYWYSDYTWGWAPFHYGRWFHHSSYGWCWAPGTVWGPSWVTWRVTGEYAGWAPLPPSSFISISIGVSWSTPYYWYTYVPAHRICDPRPRHCAVPYSRLEYLHKQARPCNRYEVARDNTIVNRGLDPDQLVAGSGATIPRTRVARTDTRPQPLRRGETFDAATGQVRSLQPARSLARSDSTRTAVATPKRPTRQVPTAPRAVDREPPDNALVMRGVPRSASGQDGAPPTRRMPSAAEERGSFFSARVPPGSIVDSGTTDTTRTSSTPGKPAPAGTTSRMPSRTPTASEEPARPLSRGPTRTADPENTPAVRTAPGRTPSGPVATAPSRTRSTTIRTMPSASSASTPSAPAATPQSPSVSPSREIMPSRTRPFTVPSRSVPTTGRSTEPTRPSVEPVGRSPMNPTPSLPSRGVSPAPSTRFSPYAPASPTMRTPAARPFNVPAQPTAPRVAPPPSTPSQPPAVLAPPAGPSRGVPQSPARDRGAGRSGRD